MLWGLLWPALISQADPSQPTALASYTDTGREIFIAALHLPPGVAPADLESSTLPAMSMEFRVSARRTSARNLVGLMLLHAEVANDRGPSPQLAILLSDALANVQGGLYRGDALVVESLPSDAVVVRLNGTELARAATTASLEFLLQGWIAPSAPSTAFREALLSAAPDAALRERYAAMPFSPERAEQVAAWMVPDGGSETVAESADGLEVSVAAATASSAIVEEIADTRSTLPPVEISSKEPVETEVVIAEAQEAESVEEPIETAQLAAIPAPAPVATDPAHYSRVVQQFNRSLYQRVNAHVQYPRSALKRRLEGRLELNVVFDQTGSLLEVAVAESSGHRQLDEAALDAARNALDSGLGFAVEAPVREEYGLADTQMSVPVPVQFALVRSRR